MQLVTPPPPFETVVGMAASAKDRSWRFLPVAPTTAFWPCWHVQKADLERVLRSPVIERSSIQELRLRAGSRPTRVASRRAGLRAKAALRLRARKVDFTEGLNLTSSWLKSAFDNWNSHARLLHW
jgi:hypothetical protein